MEARWDARCARCEYVPPSTRALRRHLLGHHGLLYLGPYTPPGVLSGEELVSRLAALKRAQQNSRQRRQARAAGQVAAATGGPPGASMEAEDLDLSGGQVFDPEVFGQIVDCLQVGGGGLAGWWGGQALASWGWGVGCDLQGARTGPQRRSLGGGGDPGASGWGVPSRMHPGGSCHLCALVPGGVSG